MNSDMFVTPERIELQVPQNRPKPVIFTHDGEFRTIVSGLPVGTESDLVYHLIPSGSSRLRTLRYPEIMAGVLRDGYDGRNMVVACTWVLPDSVKDRSGRSGLTFTHGFVIPEQNLLEIQLAYLAEMLKWIWSHYGVPDGGSTLRALQKRSLLLDVIGRANIGIPGDTSVNIRRAIGLRSRDERTISPTWITQIYNLIRPSRHLGSRGLGDEYPKYQIPSHLPIDIEREPSLVIAAVLFDLLDNRTSQRENFVIWNPVDRRRDSVQLEVRSSIGDGRVLD